MKRYREVESEKLISIFWVDFEHSMLVKLEVLLAVSINTTILQDVTLRQFMSVPVFR